jgi:putative copper resistance protein D
VGVDDLWTLVRFGHVLGVTLWLGGMIVMGAVVVPVARAAGDRAQITRAARRFGALGGVAWVLILVTGFGLIDNRGLSVADLPDSEYGQRVLAKLVLMIAMGVIVALHAAWQGPRVSRAQEAGDEESARRWQILGAVFDSALLLGSLVALWLAVSLVP